MILSFALTRDEYESGLKTCTRRAWAATHLAKWQRAWDEDRLVHQGWSALPFIPGAERLSDFTLTCRPYLERLADMPEADLLAEGGMCASLGEFCVLIGKTPDDVVAVVRFRLIDGPAVEGLGTCSM